METTTSVKALGIVLLIFTIWLLYMAYKYLDQQRKIDAIIAESLDEKTHLKLEEVTCNKVDEWTKMPFQDFYIAGSAKSFLVGNQMYDHVSMDMIKQVLIMGARYLELTVMANSVDYSSNPIVATGYQQGQWQTSLNSLDFASVCQEINNYAFNPELKTHTYPLIIYLDLLVPEDEDRIRQKIIKICKLKFGDRLVYENLIGVEMCQLFGKVIIWGGNLHGLTNKTPIRRTHHLKLRDQYVFEDDIGKPSSPHISRTKGIPIVERNRNVITIVYPHLGEDVESANYPPEEGWSYGCQIVAINYQINDQHRETYFKKFQKRSIVLKPPQFRSENKRVTDVSFDQRVSDPETTKFKWLVELPNKYLSQPITLKPYSSLLKNIVLKGKYFDADTRKVYLQDTFLFRKALNGDEKSVSLESANTPGWYLFFDGKNFHLENIRFFIGTEDKKEFRDNTSFKSYVGLGMTHVYNTELNQTQYYHFITLGVGDDAYMYFDQDSEDIVAQKFEDEISWVQGATFQILPFPVQKGTSFRDMEGRYLTSQGGTAICKTVPDPVHDQMNSYPYVFELIKTFDNESNVYFMIRDYKKNYLQVTKKNRVIFSSTPSRFKIKKVRNSRYYFQVMYNDRPLIVKSDGFILYGPTYNTSNVHSYLQLKTLYLPKDEN